VYLYLTLEKKIDKEEEEEDGLEVVNKKNEKKKRDREDGKRRRNRNFFNLRACISEQFSFTRGPNAHDGH